MTALASQLPLRPERTERGREFWREVATSDVAAALADPTLCGVLWQATENLFAMNLPGVARCSVQNGGPVLIARHSPTALPDCRWFVQGLPLAAHWIQRGALALHAAAVGTTNGAVLILGNSGTGKSTIAAALALRGAAILADEVAPLRFAAASSMVAEPSMTDILLSPGAVEELPLDVDRTSLARPGLARRYAGDLPQSSAPMPVCALYILATHNRAPLELRAVRGYEKLFAVTTFAFNNRLPEAAASKRDHFGKMAAALAPIPVTRVFRPDAIWSGTELADKIAMKVGL